MNRFVLLFVTALLIAPIAGAAVKVISSTTDLSYYAEQIGGDLVDAEAIAPPTADVHFVEIRPSNMMKTARADIALKVGMELDLWMDKIIEGSRNSDVVIVDCSRYIEPLEVPNFKPDASHGDIHPHGNPHYWLGPQNIKAITDVIVEALVAFDSDNAAVYTANQKRFLDDIRRGLGALQPKLERLTDTKVVFYHNSWPYFNDFVGTIAVDFIEPYPGVPPTPSHVKHLTEKVGSLGLRVIAMEPYFDKRVPEKIASSTNARVVTMYPSIGGRNKSESYLEWFEGNLDALLDGLK